MTDTTVATIAAPAAANVASERQQINPAARRFLYALLLATAIPFIFFMAMADARPALCTRMSIRF